MKSDFMDRIAKIIAEVRTVTFIDSYDAGRIEEILQAALNENYDEGYALGYSEGHFEGYKSGHFDGFPEGYSEGHSEGYKSGHFDGFSEGHSEVCALVSRSIQTWL